jgi:hypothetical protein
MLGVQFNLIMFRGYDFHLQSPSTSLQLHLGVQFDIIRFYAYDFDFQNQLSTSLQLHVWRKLNSNSINNFTHYNTSYLQKHANPIYLKALQLDHQQKHNAYNPKNI